MRDRPQPALGRRVLVKRSSLYLTRHRCGLGCGAHNPVTSPTNAVSTLPMPNGYGDGMSIQNKSAIVLLSGGLDSMVVALQIYLPHLLN